MKLKYILFDNSANDMIFNMTYYIVFLYNIFRMEVLLNEMSYSISNHHDSWNWIPR